MSLFKFQAQREAPQSEKKFGLNQNCNLKSMEFKTSEKGEHFQLIFNVGGGDTYFTVFPITKIYSTKKGEGEIQKGHPEYQKQLEAAWDNVNEFFTTLMSAYISEQNIQDLYNSGKIVDFKTLCQYTEKAIKSNKDWENVKLDIFLQWQRKPSPNQTRTFLEIDTYAISSILHNKFICKAMEGTFKEDRTKTHLRYFNENGVEHIFKRGSYWLSEGAPYLNEQNLQYTGGSSNGGGRSVENDLFGSAATVPVGNSQADNDDLPF